MTEFKAGPELDAMIAIEVMGWQRMALPSQPNDADDGIAFAPVWKHASDNDVLYAQWGRDEKWHHDYYELPRYSRDITAAWEVVMNRRALGWDFLLAANGLFPHFGFRVRLAPPGCSGDAQAQTAPLAICLAALEAIAHATSVSR